MESLCRVNLLLINVRNIIICHKRHYLVNVGTFVELVKHSFSMFYIILNIFSAFVFSKDTKVYYAVIFYLFIVCIYSGRLVVIYIFVFSLLYRKMINNRIQWFTTIRHKKLIKTLFIMYTFFNKTSLIFRNKFWYYFLLQSKRKNLMGKHSLDSL